MDDATERITAIVNQLGSNIDHYQYNDGKTKEKLKVYSFYHDFMYII